MTRTTRAGARSRCRAGKAACASRARHAALACAAVVVIAVAVVAIMVARASEVVDAVSPFATTVLTVNTSPTAATKTTTTTTATTAVTALATAEGEQSSDDAGMTLTAATTTTTTTTTKTTTTTATAQPMPARCRTLPAPVPTSSYASLPSWQLRGDGFHMHLEIDVAAWADTLRVQLALPRTFFLDVAEVEQRYTVHLHTSTSPLLAHTQPHQQHNVRAGRRAMSAMSTAAIIDGGDGGDTPTTTTTTTTNAAAAAGRPEGVNVKSQYGPLRVHSTYAFDIEAPTFVVPYAVNDVTLTLQRHRRPRPGRRHDVADENANADNDVDNDNVDDDDDDEAVAPVFVRLSLPIHIRYEMVDRHTPFSLVRLLTHEHAYVRRCLGHVAVQQASTRCGNETRTANSDVHSTAHCVNIPVGVLADLPFVYFTLVSLMLVALLVVLVAV